jgi:phosphatidylglycerophosphate synthase
MNSPVINTHTIKIPTAVETTPVLVQPTKLRNVPNALSVARILSIPFFVSSFIHQTVNDSLSHFYLIVVI